MEKLNDKLKQFFEYIENEESLDINNIIDKFKSIFENNYFVDANIINTAYYQENTKNYYIKDSCGIVLTISSGAGDRYGDKVSHKGTDVIISSLLSKNKEVKNGISIFDESVFCKPKLSNKLDSFMDYDLTLENLRMNDNGFVYKTMPSNIKNNKDIVNYRYNQLKTKAELKNESLYNDYMISPYGGLDIDVVPVEELLYKYLQKFKEDDYFFERAITLFNCDFPNYFSEKIDECSHILYIIKHKKQYKKLLNLKELIYQYESNRYKNVNKLTKEKSNRQVKVSELLEEKRNLTSKKYNIIELVKGNKNIDKNRLSVIDKLLESIKSELMELDAQISEYNKDSQYYTDIKTDYNAIKEKLKKPFKNFSIDEDYMDLYINGEYGELVSLKKLVLLKGKYTTELKCLLDDKRKANKNYEYVKKEFLNTRSKKKYEIEL